VYGNIAQRLRLHKNARDSEDLRLGTPGNIVLTPMKQYANLFETMIGAYWVQPGVTYEEVFNWIDITFRPLFYAAEQDVRNSVGSIKNESARSRTEATLTASIIEKVDIVLGPEPAAVFQPIQPIRPGPVTRSNAARASAPHLEEKAAIEPPPSPPTERTHYERTGPILNLLCVWNVSFSLAITDRLHSQEVVDLTMLD
jgi:hypothetical protein